ncbi:uncharacterized protein LOC129768872 [Toxorhynchites rutilus septentrionalis]|uniref:uncharacterized protein LOC129768872 n=1 Tax=Toxorhynchites rutilus septentrionalis TaxID=329112 RepID=UPI0024791C34|nr:uncharacterized protein LOC129768872 [Toxorhynchites rutilus septentrionalis]
MRPELLWNKHYPQSIDTMDDLKEFVDLDKITNAEFKEQIKIWMEEQGIHANLQLQMKKDLIEQISRTALGRKISLKLQTHQGIVLSPMVLVLNTLVAEFLYTQNCHFALSVFSNEVPFKNTLPNFAKSKHFRLDRNELREIFQALGIDHHTELIEKYEAKSKEGAKSLLYIIFKSMLASVRRNDEKLKQCRKEETDRVATKTLLEEMEVGKLHRNVEKLLQRVRFVGKSIERIEELQRDESHEDNRDEEISSLKICTENISKLLGKLEACSKAFEEFMAKLQLQTESQHEIGEAPKQEAKSQEPKTYADFLNELKTTDYGKKYVAKLQKQITKLMDKEKVLLESKFANKLHKAELEHQSKLERLLSERINEISRAKERELIKSPKLTNRTSETEESVHFMKKIDEKIDQLYQHERNVDQKLVTLKSDLQKHELRQSRFFQSLDAAKTKEKKLLVLHDVERKLLATYEDETQNIIQNAKATIEQLENESDKINRSFQQYLHKQKEDKRRSNDEKVQIWQKYNDQKLELNQRELMNVNGHQQTAPIAREILPPLKNNLPEMMEFENPFKNFDPHKYLRRPKNCNVEFSAQKDRNVVDVALNTSPEPKEAEAKPPKPSSAESKKNENPKESDSINIEITKTDVVPSKRTELPNKSMNTINKVQSDTRLSELLAKDTLNLKRSIEENLQKLDEMSKTYTKSSSSSETGKQRTYNVKPTNETVEEIVGSADDSSSSVELQLSDGELSEGSMRKRIGDAAANKKITDLDSTKELLEFAAINFPIDERADNRGPEGEMPKKDSLELGSLGSLSDLDVSDDSRSNNDDNREDSIIDIVERISTGKRSLSENSWS